MLKSILKRIFYMLIVVWVVSVMAFILMRCAPGDPTATMLPDTASEEQRAALYEQLGLNQPYIIQYLKYMGGLSLEIWDTPPCITHLYGRLLPSVCPQPSVSL